MHELLSKKAKLGDFAVLNFEGPKIMASSPLIGNYNSAMIYKTNAILADPEVEEEFLYMSKYGKHNL